MSCQFTKLLTLVAAICGVFCFTASAADQPNIAFIMADDLGKVGPKVNLDELQKGDDVTLRVTDALAIRVEKP